MKRRFGSVAYTFTKENFSRPKLPLGLKQVAVPVLEATPENLEGYGYLFTDPNEFTTDKKTFEIKQWPHNGWRKLDPGTGDGTSTVFFVLFYFQFARASVSSLF